MGYSFREIRPPLHSRLSRQRILLGAHRSNQRRIRMPVKQYDVLIVGSGHSGGMAANILTSKGISCLMLNAGPEADYEKDREFKHAYELPYRGFNKPGRLPHVFQAYEFNANQRVDE